MMTEVRKKRDQEWYFSCVRLTGTEQSSNEGPKAIQENNAYNWVCYGWRWKGEMLESMGLRNGYTVEGCSTEIMHRRNHH